MGDSSNKNDKTQLLTESQVIEVKPRTNVPSADKNDRSMWKNVVVGADEFAPPAPVKSSARRWLVIGILAVAAIGTGAYFLWPKNSPPVVIPDAKLVTPDSSPPDTAPIADAAPLDAPSVDAAVDAGVPADAGVKPVKRKPPRHTVKRPSKKAH